MPTARVRLDAAHDRSVIDGLAAVRAELEVPPEFPPAVLTAATDAVGREPGPDHLDRTDLPFVTIDPPESLDLDQAFHAERSDGGWRVHYAIADVAWFVHPGDVLDVEARRRGVTLYSPDTRTPLYPPELSEGGASLLPDVDRPALLWEIDLTSEGVVTAYKVSRAVVRSRAKLSYAQVQQQLDEDAADEPMVLLRDIGQALLAGERARGGVHLPTPEQEVVADGAGWALTLRAPLPVEDWNAQISLLTGRCAAQAMLGDGVGLLRTLPPPSPQAVASLRRSALALDVAWPGEMGYAEWLHGIDVSQPRHAALASLAPRLLRGAGYLAFVDGRPKESAATHAAIAAPYAHVTAPLRRLADRYANEVVLAACAGREVSAEVREVLPELPELMGDAARRQNALERAMLDFVEASVLAQRCGEEFEATVVELAESGDRGVVQLAEPAVRAPVEGPGLVLGARRSVKLEAADPARRRVLFRAAPQPS